MLTVLDVIIFIVLLYFILRGYNRGFIKQTSTILGLLIALFIAINQYQNFKQLLISFLNVSEGMLQFISFAVLFILVNIIIHILGIIAKNILNLIFLGPLDHIIGAALGLLKGGIFSYLIVLVLSQIPYSNVEHVLESSLLAKSFLDMTPLIHNNLQDFFRP
jgi:membrane protein required for colicin V production